MRVIDRTAALLADGHDLHAKFSNLAIARSFEKSTLWRLEKIGYDTAASGTGITRDTGFRKKVKSFSYRYTPEAA